MPIVHVRALAPSRQSVAPLLHDLNAAVAGACGCPVEEVWSSFTALDRLVVGRREAAPRSGDVAFVELLLQDRGEAVTAAALAAAAGAVADGLGLPLEDVWARAEGAAPGRVFAGGALLGGD